MNTAFNLETSNLLCPLRPIAVHRVFFPFDGQKLSCGGAGDKIATDCYASENVVPQSALV